MNPLQTLLMATAILSHSDDLYKCEKCGEPLILTNLPDCPWSMIDGKWVHTCSKPENLKQ